MSKKLVLISILTVVLFSISFIIYSNKLEDKSVSKLEAVVVSINNDEIILMDTNNIIYSFKEDTITGNLGDNIIISYSGLLDKNSNIQNIEIVDYTINTADDNNISYNHGIFSKYYKLAKRKLEELTLDEKIGQLILARYPDNNVLNDLNKYKLGGYVFYEKDFKNKTKSEVIDMINTVQKNSKIPMLIAVDEEGGKIVRVSSNPNLAPERFKSSKELYSSGGMEKIKQDTINKSIVLSSLGINLNLAPVVDVTTNGNDYMYERSIGENTEITSLYAKTVINASKNMEISYTLKHFPGYGNNIDTHNSTSVDSRSYESLIANDIPPFIAGINAGAEAILVSHNIVSSIDSDNTASLSPKIHNFLRNELNFTGVIITDDLEMGATSSIESSAIKALLAGNDLIITTNYANSFSSIKNAVTNGIISEEIIDKLSFKILSWKYYKGLILEEK